jgi:menaquinone-dependent protoporphyrinogen oxidase
MTARILVAYATKYGSTREVAQAVAATLAELGREVDLQPAAEVRTIEGYDAVVVGAPVYIGHLLGDAQHFLTTHADALAELPVAVFALGPLAVDETELEGARASLEADLSKIPAVAPVDTAVFGGVFDPAKLSFSHKLLTKLPASPLHGRPRSDIRDWDAIRAWARQVAPRLAPAEVA